MNANEPLKKHRESETFCRKWKHDKVQFKFLGFDFQLRRAKSKRDGKMYLGYFPVISKESRQRIILVLRKANLHRASESTIEEIAKALNPKLRGWINYYGKFGKHALNRVMRKLDDRLGWYIMNKYKINSVRVAFDMLRNIRSDKPKLFAHWKYASQK